MKALYFNTEYMGLILIFYSQIHVDLLLKLHFAAAALCRIYMLLLVRIQELLLTKIHFKLLTVL